MFNCFRVVPLLCVAWLTACGQAAEFGAVGSVTTPTATTPLSDLQALPDTPERRAELVERYFRAVAFSEFQRNVIEQMATSIPPEHQGQFLDTMNNKLRWESIETAAKQSLAKHMTVQELATFVEFVEKPSGKSALSKMSLYMADLSPVVQQEVFRAVAQQ